MAATLRSPAAAVAAAAFLFFHAAFAGRVPAIIVFGDSSVDPGNNNVIPTLLKSNFRPYGRDFPGSLPTGRFCNGRIATDFISEALGIKPAIPAYLDPSFTINDFATGVSFASAGTGFDNDTSRVLVNKNRKENFLERPLFLFFVYHATMFTCIITIRTQSFYSYQTITMQRLF